MESGGGLIGLLVLFAAVVLLFTGRYPRHDLRLRDGHEPLGATGSSAYATLMTDEYPPFRLDKGEDEPASDSAAVTVVGPNPAPGLS